MHKQYLLMVGTYRRAVRRRALPVIGVLAHDYSATQNAAVILDSERIRFLDDPRQAITKGSAMFAITCPWPQYREIFRESKLSKVTVVIDPWNVLGDTIEGLGAISHVTNLS